MTEHHQLNLRAARASVLAATVLILIKIAALLLTDSLSIAASLVDSGLDLLMSLGAITAIFYAARPPDEDHAFGHTSVEDLTALFQALVLILSAIGLTWSAVLRFQAEEPPQLAAEGWGILAMALSMAITLALVWWQGYVARQTGNRVIAADRLHYMADLLPAAGSILALIASKLWGIWQLDAVIAVLAALVLLKGAVGIGRGAWDALMDRRADPEIIAGISAIADSWPGVISWHDLKTRTSGSQIFAQLHIELDGQLPLYEAHDIGAGLRRAIRQAYPQVDLIIHKDVAGRD
ncbi:cation diffusion facilitator family transporter [Falsigemmobacter faecalis]|uniref:Cation transporter n=1 Tax=Falsigemmobacter faecalis TaxID=2488730 RepID=A0A3P3D7C7_9RHOB|nr:cation diffusion facilitator family transporter [Falsigemmobacter faecalis]RRH70229.1 cation transporter [Falsigemmobacter faecalis]